MHDERKKESSISFDCENIAMQSLNPASELSLCNAANLENEKKRAEIRASQEQAWQNIEDQVGINAAQQYRPVFDQLSAQYITDADEWFFANSLIYEEMTKSDSYKVAKVFFDTAVSIATKEVVEVVKQGAKLLNLDANVIGTFTEKFIKAGLDTKIEKGLKTGESAYLARDRAFIDKVNTMPGGVQFLPAYLHAFQFSGPLKKSPSAKDTYNGWYQETVNNNLSGLWSKDEKQKQGIVNVTIKVKDHINHEHYHYEITQNINDQLTKSGKPALTDSQMQTILAGVDEAIKSAMGEYAEAIDNSIAFRLLPFEKKIDALQKSVDGLKVDLEKITKYLSEKNKHELAQYLKQQEQLKLKRDLESWQSITGSLVKLALASGHENLIKGARVADKVSKEVVPGALHVLTGIGTDNPLMIAQGVLEVGVAVMDIAGIISGNKGPNFQQIVLDKLNKILDKINELEVRMNAQFCLVNSQLETIYQEIRNNLVTIIREIQLSNSFIASKLDRIESRLTMLASKVKAVFDIVWFKNLTRTIHTIDNFVTRHGNLDTLAEEQFNTCAESLSQWLLTDAADPLSTGAFLVSKEPQDVTLVNEILSDEEEVEHMLGFLRGYLVNLINVNLVDANKPLYNASIWLKAATYYLKLMTLEDLPAVAEPNRGEADYDQKAANFINYSRRQVFHQNRMKMIKDRDPQGIEQANVKNVGLKILAQFYDIKNNNALFVALFDRYKTKCTLLGTEFVKFANLALTEALREKTLRTSQTTAITEQLKKHESEQIQAIRDLPWVASIPAAFYDQNWHKKTQDQAAFISAWNGLCSSAVIPFYNSYWNKLQTYSVSHDQKNTNYIGDAPLVSYLPVVFGDNCRLLLPLAPLFNKNKHVDIPQAFLLGEQLGLGKFEFKISQQSQLTDYSGIFIVTIEFTMLNDQDNKIQICQAKLETIHSPDPHLNAVQQYAKLSNYGYADMSQAYEAITQKTTIKMQYLNAWLSSKVADVTFNPAIETIAAVLESQFQQDYDQLRKQAVVGYVNTLEDASQQNNYKSFQNIIIELDNLTKAIRIIAKICGMPESSLNMLQSMLSAEYIRGIIGGKISVLPLNQYITSHLDDASKNQNSLAIIRSSFMQELKTHNSRKILIHNNDTQFGISEITGLLSANIKKLYGSESQQSAVTNEIEFPTAFKPTLSAPITELLTPLYQEIFYHEQATRYENFKKELPGYLVPKAKSNFKIILSERETHLAEYSIRSDKSIFDETQLSRAELIAELQTLSQSEDDVIRKKLALEIVVALLKHWSHWKKHSDAETEIHNAYKKILTDNLNLTEQINELLKDGEHSSQLLPTMPIYLIDALLSAAIYMVRFSPDNLLIAERYMEWLIARYMAYQVLMHANLQTTIKETFPRQVTETAQFIIQTLRYCLSNTAIQNYINEYLKDNEKAIFTILSLDLVCQVKFSNNKPFPVLLWHKNNDGKHELLNKVHKQQEKDNTLVVVDNTNVTPKDVAKFINVYWEPQYFMSYTILQFIKDIKISQQQQNASKEQILTNQRLLTAAKKGDTAELKAVLQLKPDLFYTDEQGKNAFHLACELDQAEPVSILMNHAKGTPAICCMAERTNEVAFKHEPRFEQEMNQYFEYALNHSDLSALMIAIKFDRFPIVKMLYSVQQKIDNNETSLKFKKSLLAATLLGITPIMIAAAYGYTNTVIELLKINEKADHVLELLAAFGHMNNFGTVLNVILSQQKIPTLDNFDAISILAATAILNNTNVSKFLCLQHYKADIAKLINQTTPYKIEGNTGFTLLMIAVTNNNLDLMRLYIECGAAVNLETTEALVTLAIRRRYIDALLLLLHNGAILTESNLTTLKYLITEPDVLQPNDRKSLFLAGVQFGYLALVETALAKNNTDPFLLQTDIEDAISLAKDPTINQLLQQKLKNLIDIEHDKLRFLTNEQFQKLRSIGLFNIPDNHHIVFVTGDNLSSLLQNNEATVVNCSGGFQAQIGNTPVGFNHSGPTNPFQTTVISEQGAKLTNVSFDANSYNVKSILTLSGIANLPADYRIVYTANGNPYHIKQDDNVVSFSGTGQSHGKPASGNTDKFKRALFNETVVVGNINPTLPANAPAADGLLINYLRKIGFFNAPLSSKVAVTQSAKLKLIPKNEGITASTAGNNQAAGGKHGDYFRGSIAPFKRCILEATPVAPIKGQDETAIENSLLQNQNTVLPVIAQQPPVNRVSATQIAWHLIPKPKPVAAAPPVINSPPAPEPQGCRVS